MNRTPDLPVTFTAKDHKEITIRTAESKDAADILFILRRAYTETPFLMREPEELADITIENERVLVAGYTQAERAFMLIAMADDYAAGFCTVDPGTELSRGRHRCVVGIVLREPYTGHGIGSRMLKLAMLEAAALGYEFMELEVAADNRRAIALYEKLGFIEYGRRPFSMKYKDGTYTDDVLMLASLSGLRLEQTSLPQ